MTGATSAVDRIRAERLVAVLRRVSSVEAVVEALRAGGIRIVEVTLDSEDALAGVRLMVTGGVNVSNARAFLDAGAVAVGIGSALTGVADVESEARRLVAAVSSV